MYLNEKYWLLIVISTSSVAAKATFQEDFRQAVDREARLDLVEKRKQTEAELEVPGGWTEGWGGWPFETKSRFENSLGQDTAWKEDSRMFHVGFECGEKTTTELESNHPPMDVSEKLSTVC